MLDYFKMTLVDSLNISHFILSHWLVCILTIGILASWKQAIKFYLYKCWRILLITTTAMTTMYCLHLLGVYNIIINYVIMMISLPLPTTQTVNIALYIAIGIMINLLFITIVYLRRSNRQERRHVRVNEVASTRNYDFELGRLCNKVENLERQLEIITNSALIRAIEGNEENSMDDEPIEVDIAEEEDDEVEEVKFPRPPLKYNKTKTYTLNDQDQEEAGAEDLVEVPRSSKAINSKTAPKKKELCPKCGKELSKFHNCWKINKNIICYKCHQPNHVAMHCRAMPTGGMAVNLQPETSLESLEKDY